MKERLAQRRGDAEGGGGGAIESASGQAVRRAAVALNQWLVVRNWTVGAYLVEYEQSGSYRAKYGTRLLERLAGDLSKARVRGFTPAVLRLCRLAYQTYPQIRQTVSVECGTVIDPRPIRGSLTPELPTPLSPELLLQLSWTKLQELIRIDDPWKRAFYENECLKAKWSVRQLQRQIESLLYERTGLSTNKKAVIERARTQEPQETIEDMIWDPYVLEFAGLAECRVLKATECEALSFNASR